MTVAPGFLLAAFASDSAGDPHLAPGMHLRVMPLAQLGLPVGPLEISLNKLDPGRLGESSADVRFTDATRRELVVPFELAPNDVVTAWLPSGSSCCYLEIVVEQEKKADPRLRVEALRDVPGRGPAVTAVASEAPWGVCASPIERARLTGWARVVGARWLDERAVDRGRRIDLLALPASPAPRYAPLANAEARAFARVERGAPQCFGMHEQPGASGPASCPPFANAADAELRRLKPAWDELREHLERALQDTRVAPEEVSVERALDGLPSGETNVAVLHCVSTLLQASVDPGVARLLGLATVLDAGLAPGQLAALTVSGIWQAPALPSGMRRKITEALPRESLDSARAWLATMDADVGALDPDRDLVALSRTVTAVVGRAPPRTPPDLGAAQLGGWMPGSSPLQREVVLPVSGLGPAAGLALRRASGGDAIGLNVEDERVESTPDASGDTWPRRLLVHAEPPPAGPAGSGILRDRTAPGATVRYSIASADLFGCWSEWTEIDVGPIPVPAPPPPMLTLDYVPPAPAGDGPLAGRLVAHVQVPALDALSPGSAEIDGVVVDVDGVPGPVHTAQPLSNTRALEVALIAPALERAAETEVAVRAQFVAGGRVGPFGEPVRRRIADPRPPAPAALGRELQWSSRPDATGQATVELRWRAAPNARYRLYYADERNLAARLVSVRGTPPSLDADPDTRARAWRLAGPQLQRDWFELARQTPIEPGPDGNSNAAHTLPGALEHLSIYRVTSMNRAGVEQPFTEAGLVCVAIPRDATPGQATVAAAAIADPSGASSTPVVRLTITPPPPTQPPAPDGTPAPTPALEAQIVRSRLGASDPTKMPLVVMQPLTLDAQGRASYIDRGPLADQPLAALTPYMRYTYSVALRFAVPAGEPLAPWGPPSVLASVTLVPQDPPSAPHTLVTTPDAAGVTVSCAHSQDLSGSAVGVYVLRLLRDEPGRVPEAVDERSIAFAAGPAGSLRGPFTLRDPRPPTLDTTYRVVCVDPTGRPSPPSQPVPASA